MVVASQGAVVALDPRSDKEIWSCKWGGNRYPSLVAGPGLVFVTGDGGESLAIDPTGEGDVSKTHVVWKQIKAVPEVPSPLYYRERLYLVTDKAIVTCRDAKTGKEIYHERLGGRGACRARARRGALAPSRAPSPGARSPSLRRSRE